MTTQVPEWVQRARQPIDRAAREHFVYWVYDAEGCILYIGCTRSPDSRWVAHGNTKPGLVAAAARCKMRGPYTFDVARHIEHAAIVEANPLFNLELDKRNKHAAVDLRNRQARAAANRAVLDRYGIGASA